MKDKLYHYKVISVPKVTDGDTVYFVVDLGFDVRIKVKCRLKDVDAPEIYRSVSREEKQAGRRCREYLRELLASYEELAVKTYKKDKYGRYVADVFGRKRNSWERVNDRINEFIRSLGYGK
jgi:endonuclease YncB( thermonuclease family)